MAKVKSSKKVTKEFGKGITMLMKFKGEVVEVEILDVQGDTAVVDMNGESKKFLVDTMKDFYTKQDELKVELENIGDEEVAEEEEEVVKPKAKVKSKKEKEEVVEEDDEEMDNEDDVEEEEEVKPTKKSNKKDKVEKTPKEEKKTEKKVKYWEEESPVIVPFDSCEIRIYEEACKLQLFSKVLNKKANDGSKIIAKGVTVDTNGFDEKIAINFISNMVWAVKNQAKDERFVKALELLEEMNKECNPEGYVFDMEYLDENYNDAQIKIIAQNMGIKVGKEMNKKTTLALKKEILKVQQARLDAEEEDEE